ncbi:dipeptidyl carboxypeptidase II [Serratia odorifera]|uniref:Dipeptidyl carboxypeptidase II n=1 Tax=Serratia odorifera TaxID=618 RepID=A0A3S4FUK0_SEROD|nr:hypothetical protein [Serratia odorifera]VDZ63500.1 dipeptidyl carboxypeptidase II [Serratia odorifera]
MNVFSAMTSANTNDALQKLDEETSPKLARARWTAIMLNSKLFAPYQGDLPATRNVEAG